MYMRTPTRPSIVSVCERSVPMPVCAQMTPYRSPAAASLGTWMVACTRAVSEAASSRSAVSSEVQPVSSSGVRCGAKVNVPLAMAAAAA